MRPRLRTKPLNAARRQRESPGVEVTGQAVVALGVFQRRNVEEPDEIAIVRRVLQLPFSRSRSMIQLSSSSCHSFNCSFSCSGSSIRSRYASRERL